MDGEESTSECAYDGGFYKWFFLAEPLDKNRLIIFQPTLGFSSAIGGKYGNYDRGYPQVLKGLVLKGFI